METIKDLKIFDQIIEENKDWNVNTRKELLMHKIHAYPAKFPAFLTPKIIEYLSGIGFHTDTVADIFCGCGTSALETKLLSKDFFGFDINPVATLIAKTKSQTYNENKITEYYNLIIDKSRSINSSENSMLKNERLNYWFTQDTILNLFKILKSIDNVCPSGKYKNFF